MSFRLRPDERVRRGLRRLVRKELRDARLALGHTSPPTADAIHSARKSLKKVRAIIELIDADHGSGLDGSSKRLQKVAHTLSRLRDADVMPEIVDKLRRKAPRLLDSTTLKRIRSWLSKHRRAVLDSTSRKNAWTAVDDALRALRRRARRWRPSHREFAALASGIVATHRRGRKALARAAERQRADDFHRWRKEIKNLWYELRLFESAGARIKHDIQSLHRAEEWLGDDHNIVVLCAALSKDDALSGTPLGVDRLRLAADRYHLDARKKAIDAVRAIYRRPSRRYVQGLRRSWRRWQQHQTAR